MLRHSLRAQGSEAGRGRGTAILVARLCYFPIGLCPFLKVPCYLRRCQIVTPKHEISRDHHTSTNSKSDRHV